MGAKSRLNARAVWDLLVFVLNAMIFTLLGLQFTEQVGNMTRSDFSRFLLPGIVISLVVVAVRLLWVPVATYLPRLLSAEVRRKDPMPQPRAVFLVAWTSMRGIVSLATAFALPPLSEFRYGTAGRSVIEGPGLANWDFSLLRDFRTGDVHPIDPGPVSYTHLRAHETVLDLVCRLLLEKKKQQTTLLAVCLNITTLTRE